MMSRMFMYLLQQYLYARLLGIGFLGFTLGARLVCVSEKPGLRLVDAILGWCLFHILSIDIHKPTDSRSSFGPPSICLCQLIYGVSSELHFHQFDG